MWITRDIEPRILRSARTRPVVVLAGARQTGKTSTLRRLFPDHHFVSLDLPTEAEQAEKEPEAFLRRHPPPLLVDEVQYAPMLFRHLKARVDAHRQQPGQFLLTGSQKFTLMHGVADSLAGRADIVELEPLSLAEVRGARPGIPLEEVVVRGGFPELHANPDIDAVAFYNSYLATYLERDVRSLAHVGSLRDFQRFLRACALRSADLLNKADLARDVGIAPSTANRWLSVLQASGQVVLLEPYFSNRTRSIVKSPKLYLADSGLLCALLNIHSLDDLLTSPAIGAVWETFVFAQLRARQRRAQRAGGLFFWRDRTREVDFVTDTLGPAAASSVALPTRILWTAPFRHSLPKTWNNPTAAAHRVPPAGHALKTTREPRVESPLTLSRRCQAHGLPIHPLQTDQLHISTPARRRGQIRREIDASQVPGRDRATRTDSDPDEFVDTVEVPRQGRPASLGSGPLAQLPGEHPQALHHDGPTEPGLKPVQVDLLSNPLNQGGGHRPKAHFEHNQQPPLLPAQLSALLQDLLVYW